MIPIRKMREKLADRNARIRELKLQVAKHERTIAKITGLNRELANYIRTKCPPTNRKTTQPNSK